jgi:hypothetical protein
MHWKFKSVLGPSRSPCSFEACDIKTSSSPWFAVLEIFPRLLTGFLVFNADKEYDAKDAGNSISPWM